MPEEEENPDHYLVEDEYADNELVNPEGEEEGDDAAEQVENEDHGDMMGGLDEEPQDGEISPEEIQQEGEEMPEDAEYEMAEDMAGEEQMAEELRNQIGAALEGFRQQRESLEAMKEQAPELTKNSQLLAKH